MVWTSIAKDYGSPLIHPIAYFDGSTSKEISELLDGVTLSFACDFRFRSMRFCPDDLGWRKQGQAVLKKLDDKEFFDYINESQRSSVTKLINLSGSYSGTQWREKSSKDLAKAFFDLYSIWRDTNAVGNLINLADFENNWLSQKITGFIKNKTISPEEAAAILLTPSEPSQLALADESFFKILAMKQEGGAWQTVLAEHVRKFDWLEFQYDGPTILDENYFLSLLESEERQGVSGRKKLEEIKLKNESLLERQTALAKELGLSQEELYWINVAKTFMYLKDLRKSAVFYASRHSDSLIKEISKRLGLSPIQVRHLSLTELINSLEDKPSVSIDEVNSRINYCVLIGENDESKLYSGKTAVELGKKIVEEKLGEKISELKGNTAFPGLVHGIVKLVLKASDMTKVNEGDVLVAHTTNPNIVSAMKRAGAIVTDEGGVTCHAAIVSRELHKPCVIGTKYATQWLNDGEKVEVDASKGIIKKLI